MRRHNNLTGPGAELNQPLGRRFPKMKALLGSVLLLGASFSALAPLTPAAAAQSTKLVAITFENKSYDNLIGNPDAPYLNQLFRQGTLFSNYTAVASGSNPNYLAMTSGLTSALTPPSPNIFQAIEASGSLTWKEFMESMTGTCGAGSAGTVPGSTDPLYTTDHDPALAYQGNVACNQNDVPLTSSSLSNLPSFSYIVPNECNDMHTPLPSGQTCPAFFGPNSGTSQINTGDNWLATVVPQLLSQPNVTVLITWDENDSNVPGSGPTEHIVTLEVGAGVTVAGIDGNSYNHYGLEAGLYHYFGLGAAPNNGSTATPLPIPASGAPLYAGPPNAITQENSNPGTTAWLLTQQADGYNQQIDGYASATSVNQGQQINFYVSVNSPQSFTMDFYRMGYYQGMGGRFMLDVPNLPGLVQPTCPMDSGTGMITCNWATSYQLTIPTSWTSGVYLVKLTNAAGYQNYIIFAVRNDASTAALLYQVAFNTYEAYNNFPNDVPPGSTNGLPLTGKSVYDFNSSSTPTSLGTQRAVQVSFDRPFTDDGGAGAFLNYEINDVAWLEQQGYDLTYASDVDTDLSGGSLLNHHGFISAGHDEYWSMSMFNAATRARDSGVNLAFLGADDVSWQVRFAASAAGVPDRVLICYKSATLDPVQNNTVTVHFRDSSVGLPEQLLVGATSSGEQLGASNATPVPYVVQNPSNWVYANTGAFNNESVANVVGYEIDAYNTAYPQPTAAAGTYQLLSSSPIVNTNNQMVTQNTTIYQAASGAWVFSGSAIEWGWSLFDFGFNTGGQTHPNYANPFIQIMTANIINKFSAGTLPLPAAPTNLNAIPSASAVNLSWTDNDATATYELDRSSDPAFDTFIAFNSLPAGATSFSDTGLSPGAYYYRLVAANANGKSPYVSASAATTSYAALIAGRTGMLAHWRLGESSGTTAFDTTGTYPGTYVNSPTLGSSGAIPNDPNTSVTFNGSSQRATIPTIPSVGDFSIEGWSYLTTASVNNNALYAGNGTVRLLARPGTGSFLTAAYGGVTLNGTEYLLQPNSPASNVNSWVYWVLSRQGNLLTLYRNGVQIGQRSDLPATATANINGYIAEQSNGLYYLTGRLQDVALYTRALSGTEVRNAYATALNGIAPPPPLIYPSAPGSFTATPSASAVRLSWTDPDSTSSYVLYRGTDPGFSTPVTITLPAGSTGYTDTGLGQGVFYYKLLASNTGGQSPAVLANAATMSYTSLVDSRSGLVAHWRLNEASGTTAWDTTSTYNGVYANAPTLGSPGAIANDPATSTTFNGSTQRVTTPALPSSQDFSLAGWTYLTNSAVNNNTIYGSGTLQFLARPGTGSFNTAAYAAVTLNGTLYALQPTATASNINTWVAWVMTRQGATLTLYRNGVQIAQRTDLPATGTVSLSGYIADESNNSYYLTGRIQDVAVYNRALSSLEVTNGYNTALNGLAPAPPAPITTPYYNAVRSEPSLMGYWRLGEASGTTAVDVMGKANGTYLNAPTHGAAGAIVNDPDASTTFNGSNQAVTVPALGSVGDFTIEGWARLTNATVNNNALYSGGASTVQLLARPGTGSFVTAAYANVTLNGTSYVLQPNSPASNINAWVYFVMTRQGSTLNLYRNGVIIGQRTDLPATATVSLNGYIGEQVGGAYFLNGGIDEVAVYNSALTPQDITSHYQSAQSGPAPHATSAPTDSVTQPTTGGTYGGNWSGAITGTASSTSGFALTSVSVAVKDTSSGQWWSGSAFNQATQTFVPVTSGTSAWSLTFPAGYLTSGHSYSVTSQAVDYVGNTGTSSSVAFTYNGTPPTASVAYPVSGRSYGGNWAGSITGTAASNSGAPLTSVAVALQDSASGLWWSGSSFNQPNQLFLPVSSGATSWSFTFPAVNFISGHTYVVFAQATDGLGNTATGNSVVFTFNSTAPTTSALCNAGSCSTGWYSSPVSVSLSATDGSGPGVSATYYTTDGSTPTTSSTVYTGAFSVSSTSTIKFFSVDQAGNVESVKSQLVQIDTVAPTSSVSCNGTACAGGWYGGPVTVTLAAIDNNGGAGVYGTFYTTDGSTPTTASSLYSGPFTVSNTSTVKFFSLDLAGNAEAVKSQSIQIDGTAPTTAIACNGTTCASGWYNGPVSVTLSPSDNSGGSGVAATYYTTDGTTPTTSSALYSGPFVVSSSATIKFFSIDTGGNAEAVNAQSVQIDTAAPTTTISCNGGACSAGWYNAPVTVALAATDNAGGSGIAATYYTTDGSTPTTASARYSGPFTVSATATVQFFSVDNAGNAEAVRSQQIQIDSVAPASSITCNGASCGSAFYNAPVTVALSFADSGGSGVAATYYTTNGSTPTTSSPQYTAPFTVSATTTVQFFSVDNAGNAELSRSQLIQVDTAAPTSSIVCNGGSCATGFYNAPVTATLSATDNAGGSGVTAIYYTTDGSTPTTSSAVYAGPFTVSSTSTVQFFSVDNAGNAESVRSQLIQIDSTAPTTTVSCDGAACSSTQYANPVSVSLTANDNLGGSGVSATYYTLDGSTPTTSSTPYGGPFTVSRTSTLQFFSIDAAGNAEPVKLQQLQVAAHLLSIAITPANPSIPLGASRQFTATGTYSDGGSQNLTSSATWASSTSQVASISSSGLAGSVGQGSTQISASFGGFTDTTTLTVGPPALVSIAVTPANPSIAKGNTQQFTATGAYSDNSSADLTGSVTWASSNSSVATVNASGLATGAAQGTTQISASFGGVSDRTTLTVGPALLVSMAVSPANPSIPNGTTQQFTATGTYTDGSTQDLTQSIGWASSDVTAATITSAGVATALGQGSTQISATAAGGVTANTTLSVGPAVLVSIAVAPANPSIPAGTTQQFTATGTYSDGSNQDVTQSVSWSSSATSVATITSLGLASAAGQGTTTIRATSAGVTGTTTLTVGPAALVSLAVTPANPTIAKGLTQQFTATGTYTDGTTRDLTGSATWTSSNSASAPINASGLANGAAQGTSQIRASVGAMSDSTTLTVGPAILASIAVTPANPTIAKGTSQQLSATGTYSDGTTQDLTSSVTWTSATTTVATISSTGLASGAAQGTSQISASSGGVTGATTLTVGPPALVSIALTPSNATIPLGASQQFTATGTYTDGSLLDVTNSTTWTSSNPQVASIAVGGLATSAGQGTTQITATSSGVTAGTALTVGPAALLSIAVTPVNPSIPKGTTQQFTATGSYSDGTSQNLTNSATWSSSNGTVATVTAGGLATGSSQGTSQISASLVGVTGSASLTVTPPALVSIAVTPPNPSIPKGTSQQFTATGTYTDSSTLDLTTAVTWTSSSTTTAPITAGGLATGAAQGSSQISATASGVSGSTTLTIGPAALVSIAVTPVNPSIPLGATQQFSATGTYSDGTTQDLTSTATWASSNPGVATVSSAGLATAVAQSTTEISATSAGVKGTTTLTVGPAVLRSIAVTPATASIAKGNTQQFTATGTYSDGSTQNLTNSATWASSSPTIATINASGLASGLAQGTSQISAATAGVTGTATLTVGPAVLVSIAVTPANATIPKGTTQQFTATGTYSDGSTLDLTSTAKWATSNSSVASINGTGLATAKAQGSTTISATSGTVKGSTTLTVGPAALKSIAVTPANQSVTTGTKVQYTATGTYTDGTKQTITSSVTWSSSNTTVATITSGGLATTLSRGTTTIKATQGSISGSTTLKAT